MSDITKLCFGRLSPGVTTLGPGRRIVLWVRGCDRDCPGCIAPELARWDRDCFKDVSEVLQMILQLAPGHDGLTVSGGEPLAQAGALAGLLKLVRRHTVLDIMVYSGFTLEEIQSASGEMPELLKYIDILVDGPYRRDLSNRKLWRGSDNQRLYLLTARTHKYRAYAGAEYEGPRTLHMEIDRQGEIYLAGIPDREFAADFKTRLARRGIMPEQG